MINDYSQIENKSDTEISFDILNSCKFMILMNVNEIKDGNIKKIAILKYFQLWKFLQFWHLLPT